MWTSARRNPVLLSLLGPYHGCVGGTVNNMTVPAIPCEGELQMAGADRCKKVLEKCQVADSSPSSTMLGWSHQLRPGPKNKNDYLDRSGAAHASLPRQLGPAIEW